MIYNDLFGNKKHTTCFFSCPSIANLITLSLSKLKPAIMSPQNCKTISEESQSVAQNRIKSNFSQIPINSTGKNCLKQNFYY